MRHPSAPARARALRKASRPMILGDAAGCALVLYGAIAGPRWLIAVGVAAMLVGGATFAIAMLRTAPGSGADAEGPHRISGDDAQER